ncbi:hypothetical protein [Microbacterium sp. 1262]|uniref:hypothetical protein n=1 Tax=Microbacterium sp. 1262 TaxID=3156415 RepID=UPI00339A5C1C
MAPLNVLRWTPTETQPPVDVAGALVCVYQVEAPASTPTVVGDGGLFAATFSLDADEAAAVLEAAAARATGAHCSETASRFVVVHPDVTAAAGGAPLTVTVELDGCQRIVGSDFQTRPAPPSLIPLLSP